jgi:hypothetical protein
LRCDDVEAVGGGFVEAVEEVPVHVEDGSDGGVAEACGDRFGVFSLGDEEGGVGVPEVVESAGLADGVADGGDPLGRRKLVPRSGSRSGEVNTKPFGSG